MAKSFDDNWGELARQFGFEVDGVSDDSTEKSDSNQGSGDSAESQVASKSEKVETADVQAPDETSADAANSEVADSTSEEERRPRRSRSRSGRGRGRERKPNQEEAVPVADLDEEPDVAKPDVSTKAIDSGEKTEEDTGVESVEFDIQDLSDEGDDRPRRRRTTRRRRRAVIEELKEELEREKGEETDEEPVVEAEVEVVEKDEEDESPKRSRGNRRRRSPRTRRDPDVEANREESPVEDSVDEDSVVEDDEPKVSKNRRRRSKRENESTPSDGNVDRNSNRNDREDGAPRPERRFPTWEEAISPVVDANIERTSKPQRKRRAPRRRED